MGAPRFSSRADFLALTAEICFGRTALGCADAHATGLEYSHYPESWARTVIGTRLPKLASGEPEAFTAAIMVMYMEVWTECAGLVGRKGKHL